VSKDDAIGSDGEGAQAGAQEIVLLDHRLDTRLQPPAIFIAAALNGANNKRGACGSRSRVTTTGEGTAQRRAQLDAARRPHSGSMQSRHRVVADSVGNIRDVTLAEEGLVPLRLTPRFSQDCYCGNMTGAVLRG